MRKNYSAKTIRMNNKFNSGDEIINKLDNLYHQSMSKPKLVYEFNNNELSLKEFPSLRNKLKDNTESQKKSKIKLTKCASIDSITKITPQKDCSSNEHQTLDATKKTSMISKIFNTSSKYKIRNDLKTVKEIENLKEKKNIFRNINDIREDNKLNDYSFYSNKSERENMTNINYNKESMIENKTDKINEKKSFIEQSIEKKKTLNKSLSQSSLGSYKPDQYIFPFSYKDYYSSMLDKNRFKRREKIIQNSLEFYLHKQKFLSKSNGMKKKEYYYNSAKKIGKAFSELKRVPLVIAFGKVVPKESINIKKQTKKQKFIKPKKTISMTKSAKNVFISGLNKENSINKLKESKLIKDDYNTNNPNTEDYIPKDQFGNIVYPILVQKKMLKNIMPKEYDYNTKKSPLELLHDTYHPLLRFQKKMLAQHINAINQEIGVTYSKHFTLVDKSKIPEKFQMAQDLIDLQKDEKLIKLIRELIDRNFGLEREVEKALDLQKKEKEMLRKKQIYKRFCEVMLKASIHFKRLNISLEDFYSIPDYIPAKQNNETNLNVECIKEKTTEDLVRQKQLIMRKNGQHFFEAIRAEDTQEIIRIMNSNYFIMFYRDHFMQSPLHISAKRNLYQFISLFISRGADINAQDEGGRTALLIAAEKNNIEFVTILLFEIADPSIKNAKGLRAYEVTTNSTLKLILERAKILHYFHKIGKIQQFNESIRNGLSFLYKEELGINCDVWIKENMDIIKECEQ